MLRKIWEKAEEISVKISDGGKGFSGRAPRPTDAQIVAQAARNEVRNQANARKIDTRRKVVLGGALIAAARTDPAVAKTLAHLLTRLDREQDRRLFRDWKP